MPSCNSDSLRRYTLKCLYWYVEGKVGELVQSGGASEGVPWGLLGGINGRRKLCMVIWRSCHIYGIWRSKEIEKYLKSSFEVTMQATRRDNFYGRKGLSLCNITALKLIVSLTGYCKLFYRTELLFSILMLFYLFCIYWDWQGQQCHLKCPKVYDMRLTLSYNKW